MDSTNTAPSQLDTERAGGYVARRLLTVRDPEGLARGAANLFAWTGDTPPIHAAYRHNGERLLDAHD